MNQFTKVFVPGGAGYVGAVLVPKLLAKGYKVKVYDLFLFGEGAEVFPEVNDHPNLEQVKGDVRDYDLLRREVEDCDAVIHLACISNDPSFELNPELSKTINYDSFESMVQICKEGGVQRFIFASSSSVYGVSDEPDVTEEHPLVPLTDYNKYKGMCEPVLLREQSDDFTTVVIRPATVCGYSPRLRLDLSVNILTNHAVNNARITVFGGEQMRPNIHIEDVTDLYVDLLEQPAEKIAGQTFNAGWENHTIANIARMVRTVVQQEIPGGPDIEIVTTPSDDKRSYHISSEKIRQELGFVPRRSIEDAVRDLTRAFKAGKVPDAMTDPRYFNIKTIQDAHLR